MTLIALTGTPGTGKTTVADRLTADVVVHRANELAHAYGAVHGHDDERDAAIIDEERLASLVRDRLGPGRTVVEGHIAHLLSPDRVIVLRCEPAVLRARLSARGWAPAKIEENVMAETLNVIGQETECDDAWEVDTTTATIDDTVEAVQALVANRGATGASVRPLGGFDWSSALLEDVGP